MGFLFRGPSIPETAKSVIDASFAAFRHAFGTEACALQLPTREAFPLDDEDDPTEQIHACFRLVCEAYGITPGTFLLAEEVSAASALPTGFDRKYEGAAGKIYASGGERPLITYNPRLVERPVDLIATFAHEVAHHYRDLHGNPGEDLAEEEALVDLTAIYKGWGLFHLRSSARVEERSNGVWSSWSFTRQGYLGLTESAYALACYARLQDIPFSRLENFLTGDHYRCFRSVARQV